MDLKGKLFVNLKADMEQDSGMKMPPDVGSCSLHSAQAFSVYCFLWMLVLPVHWPLKLLWWVHITCTLFKDTPVRREHLF